MRLAGDQKKKAKKSIEGAAIDMSSGAVSAICLTAFSMLYLGDANKMQFTLG